MVTVSGLSKQLNGRTIIRNLSFRVRQGEKLCLFAPSGAGKTTLIRILAGLDKKYKGDVAVNARLRTAVFQEPSLFWYKTVEENIQYPLKLNDIAMDKQLRRRYDRWMEVTGLRGFESYYPQKISGGMKQKAALVRAFLIHPDLVLLDEPFKSIDMSAKQEIMAFIRKQRPDISLVLVTHHPEEIPLLTDRVLVFSEGCLSDACESSPAGEMGGVMSPRSHAPPKRAL